MAVEDKTKVLEELRKLRSTAIYTHSKNVLTTEIEKLEKEIAVSRPKEQTKTIITPVNSSTATRTRVQIKEHAFDESDKFVKVFIPFNNCQISDDNVEVNFTSESFHLVVHGETKDYEFVVKSLLKPINVEKSYRKVKDDMISVYLKKEKEMKWEVLTKTEKVLKDQKNKAFEEDKEEKSDDPMGGLMNIMKKMYESGDPEMKRSIAKAWTEGQEKKGNNMF